MHNREEPVPILIIQDPITSSVEDLGVMVSFVYVYVMVKYAYNLVCANIISFLLLYSLAAYSCQAACPGGSSDECPGDSYCYADVPCTAGATPPPIDNISGGTTTFDKYCGTSPENAAENCWQPCRDNADCCAGQTCHGATSCPVYANNVGADHFFCGTGMIYP